jgi:hypothetical protein
MSGMAIQAKREREMAGTFGGEAGPSNPRYRPDCGLPRRGTLEASAKAVVWININGVGCTP